MASEELLGVLDAEADKKQLKGWNDAALDGLVQDSLSGNLEGGSMIKSIKKALTEVGITLSVPGSFALAGYFANKIEEKKKKTEQQLALAGADRMKKPAKKRRKMVEPRGGGNPAAIASAQRDPHSSKSGKSRAERMAAFVQQAKERCTTDLRAVPLAEQSESSKRNNKGKIAKTKARHFEEVRARTAAAAKQLLLQPHGGERTASRKRSFAETFASSVKPMVQQFITKRFTMIEIEQLARRPLGEAGQGRLLQVVGMSTETSELLVSFAPATRTASAAAAPPPAAAAVAAAASTTTTTTTTTTDPIGKVGTTVTTTRQCASSSSSSSSSASGSGSDFTASASASSADADASASASASASTSASTTSPAAPVSALTDTEPFPSLLDVNATIAIDTRARNPTKEMLRLLAELRKILVAAGYAPDSVDFLAIVRRPVKKLHGALSFNSSISSGKNCGRGVLMKDVAGATGACTKLRVSVVPLSSWSMEVKNTARSIKGSTRVTGDSAEVKAAELLVQDKSGSTSAPPKMTETELAEDILQVVITGEPSILLHPDLTDCTEDEIKAKLLPLVQTALHDMRRSPSLQPHQRGPGGIPLAELFLTKYEDAGVVLKRKEAARRAGAFILFDMLLYVPLSH